MSCLQWCVALLVVFDVAYLQKILECSAAFKTVGRSLENLATMFSLDQVWWEYKNLFPYRLWPALMRVSSARKRGLQAIDSRFGSATTVSVCEKSVSTFYCPSLSQTSTVGKVSSVKLFHKLSKNTASRKPTKTSSLQARNYQTTSAVSKTLPGFQNSKQNSKSTNKVKSTSAILYFWINSVHGKQKAFKT